MVFGNKRGIEMVGPFIVGLIIAVAIIAFSLFMIFKGAKPPTSGTTDLDNLVIKCGGSDSINSKDFFCSEFTEVTIGGVRKFVTCDYLANSGMLSGQSFPNCDENSVYNLNLVGNCVAKNKKNVFFNDVEIKSNPLDECAQLKKTSAP